MRARRILGNVPPHPAFGHPFDYPSTSLRAGAQGRLLPQGRRKKHFIPWAEGTFIPSPLRERVRVRGKMWMYKRCCSFIMRRFSLPDKSMYRQCPPSSGLRPPSPSREKELKLRERDRGGRITCSFKGSQLCRFHRNYLLLPDDFVRNRPTRKTCSGNY